MRSRRLRLNERCNHQLFKTLNHGVVQRCCTNIHVHTTRDKCTHTDVAQAFQTASEGRHTDREMDERETDREGPLFTLCLRHSLLTQNIHTAEMQKLHNTRATLDIYIHVCKYKWTLKYLSKHHLHSFIQHYRSWSQWQLTWGERRRTPSTDRLSVTKNKIHHSHWHFTDKPELSLSLSLTCLWTVEENWSTQRKPTHRRGRHWLIHSFRLPISCWEVKLFWFVWTYPISTE